MKSLLIISGGPEAVPGIKKAKEMGLYVIVSDQNPNAIGFEFSDDKIIASTYDHLETSLHAVNYDKNNRKIDGVIAMASDVPFTVAYVANKLGLPGLSLETAMLSSDKIKMKDKFVEKKIPIPKYWEISDLPELKKIVSKNKLPLIIKPVDSRGSRGVLLLKELEDLEWAFKYSQSQSKTSRVMIEEYLEGPQVSTEAIIIDGKGYTVGFSDRNYEFIDVFPPYIIENGGDMPSNLRISDINKISECAIKAGLALGVTNGIVKGDMVLTNNGPKVIEVATRLSGGWFSTDQIPVSTGIDLIEASIKQSLGISIEKESLIPTKNIGVAIRYFFPSPGKVTKINHFDLLKSKDYVHKIGLFIKRGDIVTPYTDHTKRAGYVITTGYNKKDAIDNAELVVNTIEIVTEKI